MSSSEVVEVSDTDLPFEEELLRNPQSLKSWQRYIEARSETRGQRPLEQQLNVLYERALKELPGSYKLWRAYIRVRRQQLKRLCVTDAAYEVVNVVFERALVFMHKMPRIWLEYIDHVIQQRLTTRTRRVCDRALRALPITQHARIWTVYAKFASDLTLVPVDTAINIFKRYMKLCPEDRESYVDYLISVDKLDEAGVQLAIIVNDQEFVSKADKSQHTLWNELCQLISKHPDHIRSLDVEAILRGGLKRYTDQTGHLWTSLADYFTRSALIERARDVYEEAVQTVTTVRDFTQVFDAYALFEERILADAIKRLEVKPGETQLQLDVELYMARFEHLIERRPLLLNSVLLRQNPHNVAEWQRRVELLENKPNEIIETYTEAVQTVDPKQVTGGVRLYKLWVDFAKFYEKNEQLEDANIIFERASRVPFVKVDDLAAVYCEWVEMELRHERFEEALKLLQRATAPPPRTVDYYDTNESAQRRVHKSLRVWSLYADLEESFGTFATTKAVYERILELKIATPQIVINYGLFLKEQNYFEEAFKAYEKGVSLFKWPHVFDIWNTYLTEFLQRYGGDQLERARDLFEQCLENCPSKFAKPIFLLYAKLEEEHGLARSAMRVYERAIDKVDKKQRMAMFNTYLRKASEIYGVTRTRAIYEKALEVLTDEEARIMGQRFAEMETKLGEIDRARAIYSHCSQLCDPRVTADFWTQWKDFEVKHGNEDTVREMLRIKRSVQHAFNTQVNVMAAQMVESTNNQASTNATKDGMRMLEEATTEQSGEDVRFVRGEEQSKAVEEAAKQSVVNPDEIDLDDDDDDDEEDDEDDGGENKVKKGVGNIEEQAVPSQVFGGLVKETD